MGRVLSVNTILELWERVQELPAIERALTIWSVAAPERSVDQLARAPLGARDRALLELRVANFGRAAPCYAECPACATAIEFDFDLGAALGAEDRTDGAGHANETDETGEPRSPGDPHELELDHLDPEGQRWRVRFRLPSSADLSAALARGGPRSAIHDELLARCVVELRCAGELSERMPAALAEALVDEMGRRDPLADIAVRLECSSCSQSWSAPFDIGSYLWSELERRASGTLREVDALARAYGWSETEILALSPRRRRAYLEVLGLR